MPYVLATPPTAEPVSSDEALTHLRVEGASAAEIAYVSALISAAREWVERYTGRALISQAWDLFLDAFPCGAIGLAKGRVSSVSAITYFDGVGDSKTLDAAEYQADLASIPARVLPAPGAIWPVAQIDRANAVQIRFVAGYGDAAAVPGPIKSAMLLLIGHLYEHRESEVLGAAPAEIKLGVDALLSPYRVHGFG